MYERQEDVFYYLTLYNENYPMLSLVEVAEQTLASEAEVLQGVVDGGYCFYRSQADSEYSVRYIGQRQHHAAGFCSPKMCLKTELAYAFGVSPVLLSCNETP